MISDRTTALLQASATIYATIYGGYVASGHEIVDYDKAHAESVADAYALLDRIETREKANCKTREVVDDQA